MQNISPMLYSDIQILDPGNILHSTGYYVSSYPNISADHHAAVMQAAATLADCHILSTSATFD